MLTGVLMPVDDAPPYQVVDCLRQPHPGFLPDPSNGCARIGVELDCRTHATILASRCGLRGTDMHSLSGQFAESGTRSHVEDLNNP